MIQRALLGVADRSGLVELARGLRARDIELIATDGTRQALEDAGIEARAVSDLTHHPEMLGGRVKTLHPAIHAGILARRDLPEHLAQLAEHGYPTIDLVVVSLYPFAETVAAGSPHEAIIEKIDIGGPTMIRAAAKNSDHVAVLVSPSQYGEVLAEIDRDGDLSAGTRRRLAAEAFAHVAAYDAAVAAYLASLVSDETMPDHFTIGGPRLHQLRYGENPHQRGALYAIPGVPGGLAHACQLQGPALSFTNWLDVDAARRIVIDFDEPAAVVVKHTNPCGFAVGADAAEAYRRAYECDSRSAYGGIVAINRALDLAMVEALGKTFLEAVVAPAVTPEAAAAFSARERVRLLAVEAPGPAWQFDVRSIDGGLLVQTLDRVPTGDTGMRVVTAVEPSAAQWRDLTIAWRVCRHVKSNAVVVVADGAAVGVGAGQMSRVEAAQLAVARAAERAVGAVAASDAFFPMADGLETLALAGVVAIVQPGGSKKDDEIIAAADRCGIAMVMTGERHFRH